MIKMLENIRTKIKEYDLLSEEEEIIKNIEKEIDSILKKEREKKKKRKKSVKYIQ